MSQLSEMLWLKLRHGIGPAYYQVAQFWRFDVPWRHKTSHLGAEEYQRRLATLNPDSYRKLSQSKIAEKAILTLYSVPTPCFIGHFHPLLGRSRTGAQLRSKRDLTDLLARERRARLCFKPVEGWGGMGFQAVEVRVGDDGVMLAPVFTTDWVTLETYADRFLRPQGDNGWVLEEYLEQHEQMRAFNPTSVNTMRLWVVRRGDERPSLLGGYLRIGRGGAVVDNQTSGGIVAPIDASRAVLRAATDGFVEGRRFPVHPDHGAPIEGRPVPCWAEAVALAESTLLLFPGIRFAGFDVAVTPHGPMIVELNVSPDLIGAAFAGLAVRDALRS
jgi:hypothetical protein